MMGNKKWPATPANVNDSSGNAANTDQNKMMYSTTENTLEIYFTGLDATANFSTANGKIRLSVDFLMRRRHRRQFLNGREFTISSVQYANRASDDTMHMFK